MFKEIIQMILKYGDPNLTDIRNVPCRIYLMQVTFLKSC